MTTALDALLVQEGLISRTHADEVIALQRKQNKTFGELAVDFGFVDEEALAKLLSARFSLPLIIHDAQKLVPVPEQHLEHVVPYEFAQRRCILPLFRGPAHVTVAVFDPADYEAVGTIEKLMSRRIHMVVACRSELKKAIRNFYEHYACV